MLYVITAMVDDVSEATKVDMQRRCLTTMEDTYKDGTGRLSKEKMVQIQSLQTVLTNNGKKPLTLAEVRKVFNTTLQSLGLYLHDDNVTNTKAEPSTELEDEAVLAQPRPALPFNLVDPKRLSEYPVAVQDVFTWLCKANKLGDCRFNVLDVLSRVHLHLSQPKAQVVPRMMGGGRTQIGKTFLKVVTALMAHRMKLTTVVITSGSVNVSALSRTIKRHLNKISDGVPPNAVPHCFEMTTTGKDEMGTPFKGTAMRKAVDDAFKNGGVIVVNYSHTSLDKVLDRADTLGARDMVLILDEADEFYKAGTNKQEQELARFENKDFNTRLIFDVTATILPVLLRGVLTMDLEFDQRDVVILVPEMDYRSTEDLQRLTRYGSAVNLVLTNLSWRNQYLDEELLKLYDDAFLRPNVDKCLALIVDISNPRVSAEGGLSDKANVLMKHYSDVKMRILLVTGSFLCHTRFDHEIDSYTK